MKRNKRAFTIVELVIVVAVIGVLAAILIPTFVNLTNKAKKEADNHLVSNLNTALAMAEGDQGTKNKTMHDAVLDLHEYGFELDKIVSMSEYDLLWDQNTNRFLLNSEKNVGVNYWHIERSMPSTQKYSIYAGEKWTLKEITGLKVGFDSGYHDDLKSVEYVGIGSKQTVTLRTYGENVTVNAPLDTVNHYAVAKTLTITAVGPTDCYHEYGTVGKATISSGKLIVEDTGFIANLNGESEATVEVQGVVMAATGGVTGNITGNGNYPSHSSDILDVENFDELQGMAYACNLGTTFEGKTIRLLNDIDMTNKLWVPFGIYSERQVVGQKQGKTETNNFIILDQSHMFMGNIDGNNKKIINLSNKGYNQANVHESVLGTVGSIYGLIAFGGGNITIKDLDISFDIKRVADQPINCVGIIGNYFSLDLNPFIKWTKDGNGNWTKTVNPNYNETTHEYQIQERTVRFENVHTSGTIEAVDAVSAYVGTTYLSYALYTFDKYNNYVYCTGKTTVNNEPNWYIYGLPTVQETQNNNLEKLKTLAAESGEFYEGLKLSSEVIFKYKGQTIAGNTNAVCGLAPLHINFEFDQCTNSANLLSTKRVGAFLAKVSSEETAEKTFTVTFNECSNSGTIKTTSSDFSCGVISGFMSFAHILNRDTWKNGLTNTGKLYYGENETELVESEDCDIYAAYNYGSAYHHVPPTL